MTDYIDYGQSVINFYIFILGYSLQCYEGGYTPTKDTKQEQTEKKPELRNCTGTDQVCISSYVRTDTIIKDGKGEETLLAGSWMKDCVTKGDRNLNDLFGENQSDRCEEENEGKEHIKVFI